MAQFGRPSSDITAGWTPSTGSTHWGVIDEVTPDDADYIRATGNQTFECKFSSVTDPVVHTGHVIRIRARATGSGGAERLNTWGLYDGTTAIVTSNSSITRTTFNEYSIALSEAQAGNITNYADLRVRGTSSQGTSETIDVSWAEFECPDVPSVPSDITGNTALTFSIAAALLKGIATLAGSAGAIIQTTGHLLGVGGISGSAVITVSSTGNLTDQPAGDMMGSSSVTFTGVASLKGVGSLDAVSQITIASTGVIKGVTLLSANELIQISTSGVVKGIGSLTGSSGVLVETNSILKGVGSIQTTTPVEISTSAVLTGNGVLIGSTPIGIDSNGIVKGIGVLAGNPNIEILAFGDLQNVVFDNLSGATQIRFEASGRAGQEGAKAGGSLTNTISIQI